MTLGRTGRRARSEPRYLTRLYLTFGALLAATAIAVGVALTALWQAEAYVTRTRLAHQVYEGYLALASDAWRLFESMERGLEADVAARVSEEDALARKIETRFAQISAGVAAEIVLVGDEEIEELALLGSIATEIAKSREAVAHIRRMRAQGDPRAEAEIAQMAAHPPKERFSLLLTIALDGEAREVAETDRLSAARIAAMRWIALAALAGALAIAVLGVRALRRDLRAPLARLEAGAAILGGATSDAGADGAGAFDHRIAVTGPQEFASLARAFNAMADRIAAREAQIEQAKDQLGDAVKARTAQLEKALAQLADADGARRRLLSDVSHELRTPLTIIQGEAEVALRGRDRDAGEYREALARVRDSAVHSARIVDDLLFVARAEEGVARLDLKPVDLAPLLEEKAAFAPALVADADASIRFVSETQAAVVMADAQRVRQVCLILIENALRHGGGAVTLGLAEAPEGFSVSVTDDGPGMTAAEIAQAFDRFFRGPNAARRHGRGSGLGLPVARAIVEAHGGVITLRSAPNQGVTASFTLPAAPAESRRKAP